MSRGSDVRDLRFTRRRFMAITGASAAASGMLASGAAPSASAAARDVARGEGRQLADAVLAAFERHRIVAVGETHGQQEHGDAQQMLLADPRLPQVVDDIVVGDFGNALYQATMDRFVADPAVNNPELRLVWRNSPASPAATGDEPIREQFYRTVRAVNWALRPEQRIRVLLAEPPIDWSRITTNDQVQAFLDQRDTHMASVMEREVLAKGRRALFFAGSGHVMHSPTPGQNEGHAVPIIEEQTSERIYVIVAGSHPRLASYPRRTVIPCAGTWLESADAGEFTYSAPLCGFPLGGLTDAVLYLGQMEDLTQTLWNPAIYLDPVYWAELQRRNAITGNNIDLEPYRQEQPVSWPVPAPVSCPASPAS
jgi:hypothetical protein